MHTPHPPSSSMRPSTATPRHRNRGQLATPPVQPGAKIPQGSKIPEGLVRMRIPKNSQLVEIKLSPGFKGVQELSRRRQSMSEQPRKPLSPIYEIPDLSPTPRMREAVAAQEAKDVIARMGQNRLNQTPVPPPFQNQRPISSRSPRYIDSKISGPNLGSLGGGRTRARKIGRKGRKGTNKRRLYIIAKTRRQRRGNN
jgi:hypothetical protein